jgi:hypothetical protein
LPSEVLHDDVVRAIRRVVATLCARAVGSAFVSALRPRRFEHWPVLASYALAKAVPEHAFSADPSGRRCRVCSGYERVDAFASETFAKMRAAGTTSTDPRYVLYDLERFATETYLEPGDDDRAFFDLARSRIASRHSLGALFPARLDRKRFLAVLEIAGALGDTLGHVSEDERMERHHAVPVEVAEDSARLEEGRLAERRTAGLVGKRLEL